MTKFILTLFAMGLLLSCTESAEQSWGRQTNFQIVFEDIIRIDPKGELLFVSNSLNTANYLSTTDNVYSFNPENYSIEVFNIEKAEFVNRYKFEREGPNGLGSAIRGFKMLSEEEFYLTASNFYFTKYNLNGTTLLRQDFREVPTFRGDTLLENERVVPSGEFYDNKFITLYAKGEYDLAGLAILDFDKKEIKKEQVPEFEKVSELQFQMQVGSFRSQLGPDFQLSIGNGKVIVSSDSYNEGLVFDLNNGERHHKIFKSTIMPNERVPKHTSAIMEGDPGDLLKLLGDQITFGKFYFDEVNRRFYRISYMSNGLEGEQKKNRHYLSIFDQDLNHLQDIGDLPDDFPYTFLFIRNGKMYSFLNENDEIALTVMSLVAE